MADICLLVEGAYPYVTGGVSSWIHSLVKNLPDLTFAILHVGARPDSQRKPLYDLPKNVVELCELFIHDVNRVKKDKVIRHPSSAWNEFYALHETLAAGKSYDANLFLPLVRQPGFAGVGVSDFFHSRESWNLLVKLYELHAPHQSFVDFFWTFRFTYLPIFTIFEATVPQAAVYHAVTTGFCGLLGSLAKVRTGRPFMVTEHGIYTREREIEIKQASWMGQPTVSYRIHGQRMGFFQQWWFNIYRFMESVCYDAADSIISIASINQRYQLQHGANPQKLKLVPNGVNTQQLANLRLQKDSTSDRFQVGFVGRIVPIKDVKTLIHALKIASQTIPNLEAYLVGPTEEDPHYFRECVHLVAILDLEAVVHFTGPADVRTYYGQLDVLVLTSLSEGQPLVILEGSCAGIPVIATDVGACGELLTGISPADQALGASGIITPVNSPDETAKAIIRLWRDEDLRQRMGRAGQQRIQRFYSQEQLYQTYRELYRYYIAQKEHR